VLDVWAPAFIDPRLDSRAATFENLTGARGAGRTAHGGRKGAPNRQLEPGERVVLADFDVTPESSDEEFAADAAHHPVFELRALAGA
jgi:hypothetical protein